MGGDVKLSPVSVIHGSLSIQVVTEYAVAGVAPAGAGPGFSPGGISGGLSPGGSIGTTPPTDRRRNGPEQVVQPIVIPETSISANDAPAESMRLDEGANVDELVKGLHAIGTTAHDVVAILQAIRAEGGMQADLEVQ
jgi:flagellar P-ring protein precursor FlgI